MRMGRERCVYVTWLQVYVSSPEGTNLKETKTKTKARKRGPMVVYDEKLTIMIPKSTQWDIKSMRLQIAVWDKNAVKSNVVVGGMSFSLDEIMNKKIGKAWYKVLSSAEGREEYATLGTYAYPAYGLARHDSFTSIASVAQEAVLSIEGPITGGLRLGIDYVPPLGGSRNRGTAIIKLGSLVASTVKEVSQSVSNSSC